MPNFFHEKKVYHADQVLPLGRVKYLREHISGEAEPSTDQFIELDQLQSVLQQTDWVVVNAIFRSTRGIPSVVVQATSIDHEKPLKSFVTFVHILGRWKYMFLLHTDKDKDDTFRRKPPVVSKDDALLQLQMLLTPSTNSEPQTEAKSEE